MLKRYPLRKLILAAVAASHGDLRQEVDIRSNNEIGVLSRAFNLMIHELRDSQVKLEQSIYKLEDKVKERTQQLEALTDDLKKKMKEFQEKGVEFIHPEVVQFPAGLFNAFKDPFGNVHEIVQFK